VDLLEQSIARDPGFARAHATLAVIWSRDYDLAVISRRPEAGAIGVRAQQAVQRALALDPALAEAHTARARLLDGEGDVAGMTAAYRQAIVLNPNYATARHWYGFELYNQGRFTEALVEIEIAFRLEPLAPIVASNYASALRGARRWTEALAAADRALALRPNLGEALRVRADALIELGRMAEARSAYQAVDDAGGSSSVTSLCDQIVRLARMGDQAAAEKLAGPVIAETATAARSALFRVYVALGRIEEGFAHLERTRVSAFGSRFRLEVALRPYFDRIRDDPRFVKKLEEEGILAPYREAWTQYLAWQKKTGGPTR
jgi:Tfp pilus assembly protein PilF